MDQYIGRLLDGRYEILEVIGTGGMAVVYKARCHRLNRLVALKILKDEFARDEEFRRRFRAEGEAVAMLSHPNIVQVYDVSTSESANFIVMELIDGISLKQYMEKKGVLNWKETLHFAMQIAKGLEHAHSRGIVHRDIKPHNVMVLKNGSVKVMDFGIARVMNKSNTLTKEALGSVHYISPEQAKGGHTDNRSDLYSLSVVMYEMMAGRPPYNGESAVSVAIQHINGGAARPSALNPNIPGGLEQIIMKGMALEIRDRYISATEMLQDMEEFRKNPDIVFDYRTMMDDATRTLPVTGIPKTTADKVVQARTGTRTSSESIRMQPISASQRKTVPTAQPKEQTGARNVKTIKPPVKKNDERSRAATTAIVICSGVAVVAIIIFLVALFNGALLNQEKDLVEVPYLEGEMYGEGFAARYSDFTIRLQPKEYSLAYDAGQIMHQEPAGGSLVQKGSDLWITVSMGEEPPVRKMDNLVGVSVEEAKALLENLGYTVLTRPEASFVYEAGLVTRTAPAADTELTTGQTVYFYVSTGPSVVEAKMPNVVGMEANRAKELLTQLGFTSVKMEYVESRKNKDEVIYQSVESNTEVDITSEITLLLSEGPPETTVPATVPETEAETTVPVETEPEPITVRVGIVVPIRDEDYALDVCVHGTNEAQTTKLVAAGSGNTTVELTGIGTMEFDLYINGVYESTLKVKFSDD